MTDDDARRLRHMLDYARRGARALGPASFDAFVDDQTRQLAVERAIEVVGEAASKISGDSRALLKEIAWRDIVGMRHLLAHGYAHIDYGVVYRVARDELPKLIEILAGVLEDETP